MMGIIIAFQDYKPGLGIFRSDWVGLKNFVYLFKMQEFTRAFRNTFLIAVAKLSLNLIVPICFALLLNEVKNQLFKKVVQTVTFIPYFLSWVVLSGILIDFLSVDGGFVNSILQGIGIKQIYFLGDRQAFPMTMVISDVWKNLGYNTVVYLAAIATVDPELYEAAAVDGAGKLSQIWHITVPGITPMIALMAILSLGNILNAGFEQIFNMYNASVYATGDIIDTLVYRLSMLNRQYSLSTAVNLFKSVISAVLILWSYRLAEKKAGYQIF
jgi:putative aldouronate transport system permease protein